MRRGVARVTQALALLVFAGAGTASAQGGFLRVEINPPANRVVEGDSGTIAVTVTFYLSSPNPTGPTSVNWSTTAGSALDTQDFVPAGGTVTFAQFDNFAQTRTVFVQSDTINEWSPTLQQDEFFFVDLSLPVGAAGIEKGRATVTVVDDDAFQPGVQFLSAVTDSTGSAANLGRNRLQWRVPAAQSVPTEIKIAWTSGSSSCTPPISDTAGEAPGPITVTPNAAGSKQMWTHDSTIVPGVQVPRVYCYSVFTRYPAQSAERVEVVTKTFDSTTGPIKWAYASGYYGGSPLPSVVPPTVGADGIYTIGTDGVVHAMQRSDAGGLWPPNWEPVALGLPGHNRSPVVPRLEGSRLYVGTESGELHALDARTGAIVWSRSQRFNNTQLMPTFSTGVQATPAGLFKTWGGLNDMLLVGTATGAGSTKFFAINPATGATIDDYPNGGDTPPGSIANVFGMAVVDYGTPNRVYFGTAGTAFTLWALDLGPSGSPDLSLSSMAWNPKPLGIGSGANGSPVFRGGRLYIGTDSGAAAALHSLRVSDGNLYSYTHGDGELKGFAWPDRRDGRLYFSTTGKVHGVNDDGTGITQLWAPMTFPSPSIVLQRPGTNYIYVGDGTGRLLRIDVVTQAVTPVQLDLGSVQIGAPSLDLGYDLILVGSDKGVIYAVRVP